MDRESEKIVPDTEFIRSVNDLSESNIKESYVSKKGFGAFIAKNIRVFFLLFFIVLFIISIIYVVNAISHYAEAGDIYGEVSELMTGGNSACKIEALPNPVSIPDYAGCLSLSDTDINHISGGNSKQNKEYERIRSKLITLKEQYPNLYGWISIPGADINLPVMQTTDNDYYLKHSYTGARISSGSIFVDYRCEPDILMNRNLIVYGHHMVYGGMFSNLDRFLRKNFFKSNSEFYIYTLEGMYTYKVFSVYATPKDYPYLKLGFSTDEQFVSYAKEMQSNSIYNTTQAITLDETSKLITLSTCTNRVRDGRIALHAVMVDFTDK